MLKIAKVPNNPKGYDIMKKRKQHKSEQNSKVEFHVSQQFGKEDLIELYGTYVAQKILDRQNHTERSQTK
jgi:hypothetical protein